jgi:hypothetical protein
VANYLASIQEFCDRSPFDEAQAEELELKRPGWLMRVSEALSNGIDARLIKRGDVPFRAPYPEVVKLWVADLLTPRAYAAHGTRPSDEQQAAIAAAATLADSQIAEAADPVRGLFILPLQQGSTAVQATEPATSCYSEQSPFTWKHKQMDAVARNRRYG